jgi:hypothetical protein
MRLTQPVPHCIKTRWPAGHSLSLGPSGVPLNICTEFPASFAFEWEQSREW